MGQNEIVRFAHCLDGNHNPLQTIQVKDTQMRVLIAEDDIAINDLIRMNLSDAGFTCICTHDGMAAADLLEQQSFDLILLDIMLPHIDGYELLEYIRPLKIPVIVITARSS